MRWTALILLIAGLGCAVPTGQSSEHAGSAALGGKADHGADLVEGAKALGFGESEALTAGIKDLDHPEVFQFEIEPGAQATVSIAQQPNTYLGIGVMEVWDDGTEIKLHDQARYIEADDEAAAMTVEITGAEPEEGEDGHAYYLVWVVLNSTPDVEMSIGLECTEGICEPETDEEETGGPHS